MKSSVVGVAAAALSVRGNNEESGIDNVLKKCSPAAGSPRRALPPFLRGAAIHF